ncbi:MAG: RNA polymerase sigma factor, partial [Ferruginibacter sp.]
MSNKERIAGDNTQFEELFKQSFQDYFESLHRYAYTILKNNEQAEDIVQAVFTKWWEKKNDL